LQFDKLAAAGGGGGAPAFLPDALCEAKCLACGTAYSSMGMKN